MRDSTKTRGSRAAVLTTRSLALALILCASAMLSACDAFVSADDRVERAAEHREKGQFRPAMAELKKALQSEPEHVAARVALADLSLWLGDLDSAEKELERALAAGAQAADIAPLRYELLLQQSKFEDVITSLEADSSLPLVRRLVIEGKIASAKGELSVAHAKVKSALESAPNDPEALFELARIELATGDKQAALTLPERLPENNDYLARALLLRGFVLMEEGQHSEARDAFAKAQSTGRKLRVPEQLTIATLLTEADLALNDAKAAETSLATLTRWGQTSLAAHYLRARIAMLKGDFQTAVAECQRALRIHPGHAQAEVLLASAHLAQGSTEQAQDVLTRVLASNSENLAARKLLAQVYLSRNQPSEAQRVLSAAGAAGRLDSDVDWLMGAALMSSGNAIEGLEHFERSVASSPNDFVRRVELAGAYIAARTPEKAANLLRDIPADSPIASRAKALRVLATAAGKQPAQARDDIQDLAAQNASDPMLISVAGAYLVGTGDPVLGRKLLEQALGLDPKSVQAHLALGRLEMQSGSLANAERHLIEITKIEPAHEAARIGLAQLAWDRGDRAESKKWLEEAVSSDPRVVQARLRLAQIAFVEGNATHARGLLDQALDVARDRKFVLTAVGQVLAQAGLSAEAFAKFREAALAGDNEALLQSARLHADLGEFTKAREVLESALKLRSDWRDAQKLVVLVEARDGKVERALARAKSFSGELSRVDLHVLEGDLYAIAGRAEESIASYEAAQRIQPSARLAINIFNGRRSTDPAAAERVLVQWLERSPTDLQVRRVLAAHYEVTGRLHRAAEQYERLLAADRIEPPMLNNLAWVLHERGDSRALELAERAYTAAPDYPEIADTYGWILVQMDEVPEGLAVLEKALSKAPRNADIQYHLAAAYAKSGQNERASELLRQALENHPRFHSRDAAEQLLKSVTAES